MATAVAEMGWDVWDLCKEEGVLFPSGWPGNLGLGGQPESGGGFGWHTVV